MNRPPHRPHHAPSLERGQFIEPFVAASAAGPRDDLAAFVPPVAHPLHLPVLEELIRIDLERHWLAGRPRWLEDYFGRFPQLLESSASVRTLAFEELRVRR